MDTRIIEILTLAEAGDEDVMLQVQSEIALMPETREQREEMYLAAMDEIADSYAPAAEKVSDEELAKLADDADF